MSHALSTLGAPFAVTALFTITVAMASCTSKDPASFCGDGVRDLDEQCDDGNAIAGDGCTDTCRIEIPASCGNGVIDDEETCDDGEETSACDVDCTPVACGDAIRNVAAGEACDDGNTENGDGCSDDCNLELPPFCGDGNVGGDETCDAGGETETCDDDCTAVACGDGNLNEAAGEACDDGNTIDDDGCSASCQLPPQICGLSGISCDTPVTDMVGGASSTNDFNSHPCLAGIDTSGPEHVYEWVADRTASVNLYNEGSGGVHIIVYEAQADCSVGTCLAGAAVGPQFDAVQGTKYLIVVDSAPATEAIFYIGMYCN